MYKTGQITEITVVIECICYECDKP